MDGEGEGVWIILFSEVTLFEYMCLNNLSWIVDILVL